MAENVVQPIVLPGICGNTFCVHPLGSSAYFFDQSKRTFIQTDLKTGRQTIIKTELPEKSDCALDHFVVLQSSKLFICSLFYERSNYKTFFVSFLINNDSITIIDEHDIDIVGFSEGASHYYQQIKNGQFFYYSCIRRRSRTIFNVVKIYVDDHGKVTSKIIDFKRQLNGEWLCPFIHNGATYWLPWNKDMNLQKLLKVSLNNITPEEISIRSDIIDWPSFAKCFTPPLVIGDQIFCYTYEKEFGMLLKLDMHEMCWRKVSVQLNDHIPTSDVDLKQSKNGFLYLHGNCCAINCEDNAHVYTIDVRRELEILAYTTSSTVLGRGGYGTVVKGYIYGEQAVAIKISDPPIDLPQNIREKFLKCAAIEAKNLKMLDHTNVVKGYGYKIENSRFLLFMEEMKESVRQKILHTATQRLEEKEALQILQQTLDGLVYLHTLQPKPIVHRDIKCANILLDEKGVVKLGDFGLVHDIILNAAGVTDSNFSPKIKAGTRHWQAPEVFDDNVAYGRKADVWSIGCSLVEMLTGNPPYFNLDQAKWAFEWGRGSLTYMPMKLVPGASTNVLDLLEKCFRRKTKQKNDASSDSTAPTRPYSWEILADVIRINELLPVREKRDEEIKRRQEEIRMEVRKREEEIRRQQEALNALKISEEEIKVKDDEFKRREEGILLKMEKFQNIEPYSHGED